MGPFSFANMKKITIVGTGGLGTPAAWGIIESRPTHEEATGAPLTLTIVDPDIVERSNLNRQVLFREQDLGKPKALVLKAALERLFPTMAITIEAKQESLNQTSAKTLLSGSDFVIDATDSTEAKFLLNDYCTLQGIPFCYAGVVGNSGQLLVVDSSIESNNGCLRCLFEDFTEEDVDAQASTCQQAGIMGAAAGYLGFLQADAALQHLSGATNLSGKLVRFCANSMKTSYSKVPAASSCPLGCTRNHTKLDLTDKKCPETFLYTKLALEKITKKELLDVTFSSKDSVNNVSRAVLEEGYHVVGNGRQIANDCWHLLIEKNAH